MKRIFYIALSLILFAGIPACNDDVKVGEVDLGYLPIESSDVNFDCTGGTGKIVINTSSTVAAVAADHAWCGVTYSNNIVTVTVPSYYEIVSRSTSVTVTADGRRVVVPVTQTGIAFGIDDASARSFTYTGGSFQVVLTVSPGVTADITSDKDWVTTSLSGRTVTVDVDQHLGPDFRTAVVTFAVGNMEKTVTVSQTGGVPPAAVGSITVSTYDATSWTLTTTAITGATAYKWYKDDAEVQNTSDRDHVATASGVYKVAGVNIFGEGPASATITVTIGQAPPLLFSDIRAGTYSGTGTPKMLATPGPASWTGSVAANASEQYYTFTGWAGSSTLGFYIDYYDGVLYIDDATVLVTDSSGPYYGIFKAFYVNGGYIYFLSEYSPSYSTLTKTLDFSGTYSGNQIRVGIAGFSSQNGTGYVGMFSDGYENCKLVLTPTAGTRAAIGAGYANPGTTFYGTPISVEGLQYGGTAQFDPAKFSRN